jgi:hypothetical protein
LYWALFIFSEEETMSIRELKTKRLERYKKELSAYEEAELQILGGAQSYSVGSRSLTRANLSEIRKAIAELDRAIENLENELNGRGRNRLIKSIPIDN